MLIIGSLYIEHIHLYLHMFSIPLPNYNTVTAHVTATNESQKTAQNSRQSSQPGSPESSE